MKEAAELCSETRSGRCERRGQCASAMVFKRRRHGSMVMGIFCLSPTPSTSAGLTRRSSVIFSRAARAELSISPVVQISAVHSSICHC